MRTAFAFSRARASWESWALVNVDRQLVAVGTLSRWIGIQSFQILNPCFFKECLSLWKTNFVFVKIRGVLTDAPQLPFAKEKLFKQFELVAW